MPKYNVTLQFNSIEADTDVAAIQKAKAGEAEPVSTRAGIAVERPTKAVAAPRTPDSP